MASDQKYSDDGYDDAEEGLNPAYNQDGKKGGKAHCGRRVVFYFRCQVSDGFKNGMNWNACSATRMTHKNGCFIRYGRSHYLMLFVTVSPFIRLGSSDF